MKFLKKSLEALFLLSFNFLEPIYLYADTDPSLGKIVNPINTSTIQEFIRVLLEGILKIGIPLVALAVIYCGFLFVKAQGKSEDLTKAKDALWYTLIGAAILLGSWAIAKLISETVLAIPN
ncbi:hypothetical protein A3A95_00800 [Candidatus Nomurabacteria bacterium RIFCSPLOWO2_01_FULL_39_18]|uniref:Uncharacterized protein n=1 Tax=Candidatus Nomurabacteria bacterium RIFCSPHIGHO2_01_FULL_40_24b TaxID=1801739 RepID=A0A1F6V6W3_9BACT|nr:MAG: hypothetical protein A2647_02600 [Candidatus Nomurabacteria bacterium RIFCSPHIGHO2_01_FULL_40_24b]OGI89850.1 MAG: hypothetical protein A3A95_00800 [Candidatus Nomurabacteria bacterium RIFCSPLOWO2_01_FULL_39_18]